MKQLFTELEDRILRFDGVSVVSPDTVARWLSLGVKPSQLRVTDENEAIQTFNLNVAEEEEIRINKAEPINLDLRWQLPPEYLQMDLWEKILDVFIERAPALKYTKAQEEAAVKRLELEYEEIKRRGMVEFFKTVIYIIDSFRKHTVMWGVGRGSSCASYILYIIGLHCVDCVRLKVPMEEFFHD